MQKICFAFERRWRIQIVRVQRSLGLHTFFNVPKYAQITGETQQMKRPYDDPDYGTEEYWERRGEEIREGMKDWKPYKRTEGWTGWIVFAACLLLFIWWI